MRFVKESILAAPVSAVFAFHERPDTFERLLPPWERVEVLTPPASLAVGTIVVVRTHVGPFPVRIEAHHTAYVKHERFEDQMLAGPFAAFHHKHLFFEHPSGCRLRDEIDFELPFGALGRLGAPIALRRLERLFEYRHRITREAVERSGPPGTSAAPPSAAR